MRSAQTRPPTHHGPPGPPARADLPPHPPRRGSKGEGGLPHSPGRDHQNGSKPGLLAPRTRPSRSCPRKGRRCATQPVKATSSSLTRPQHGSAADVSSTCSSVTPTKRKAPQHSRHTGRAVMCQEAFVRGPRRHRAPRPFCYASGAAFGKALGHLQMGASSPRDYRV